eukprot:gene2132-1307_t
MISTTNSNNTKTKKIAIDNLNCHNCDRPVENGKQQLLAVLRTSTSLSRIRTTAHKKKNRRKEIISSDSVLLIAMVTTEMYGSFIPDTPAIKKMRISRCACGEAPVLLPPTASRPKPYSGVVRRIEDLYASLLVHSFIGICMDTIRIE